MRTRFCIDEFYTWVGRPFHGTVAVARNSEAARVVAVTGLNIASATGGNSAASQFSGAVDVHDATSGDAETEAAGESDSAASMVPGSAAPLSLADIDVHSAATRAAAKGEVGSTFVDAFNSGPAPGADA
ncbi:unnamed protein product [Lupinus luteus]|uniref:Uncharacterized protein n=1 Tax=Lupinus luteus TaxID=3873 RepID=A0AAV1YPQ7_LUPLU